LRVRWPVDQVSQDLHRFADQGYFGFEEHSLYLTPEYFGVVEVTGVLVLEGLGQQPEADALGDSAGPPHALPQ